MPKRYGNLWDKLTSIDTAKQAIVMAAAQKHDKPDVMRYQAPDVIDGAAQQLCDMLRDHKYTPSPTNTITIIEPKHGKERKITTTSYWPDQCIHWMLMLTIKPCIMRGMYEYCMGSVEKRGPMRAVEKIRSSLEKNPKGCVWCLQMDICKFYQNTDHEILKAKFRRIIKDKDVLDLTDQIIDAYEPGMPIGFYTSPWFTNFYLQDIDHKIADNPYVTAYVRYADDMIVLGPNKKELLRLKDTINSDLQKVGMHIKSPETDPGKPSWELFRPRDKNIVYLGRTIKGIRLSETKYIYKWVTTLSHANALKASRLLRKMNKNRKDGSISERDARVAVTIYGMAREGNNWRFERDKLRPFVTLKEAKKVISDADKAKRTAQG